MQLQPLPGPPSLGDAHVHSHQFPQGRGAQGDDDGGVDELDLALEVAEAGLGFLRCGGAVVRGPAFHDVGDVDLIAGKADGPDHFFKQIARFAHKRPPLLIFILPRALADEHEPGFGVALAKNEPEAAGAERAGQAALNTAFQRWEVHRGGHRFFGGIADGVIRGSVDRGLGGPGGGLPDGRGRGRGRLGPETSIGNRCRGRQRGTFLPHQPHDAQLPERIGPGFQGMGVRWRSHVSSLSSRENN